MLCFDHEINGVGPCSLDSGMQTDALVLCKCVEEAQAAWPDIFRWIPVNLDNPSVHSVNVDIGSVVVESVVAMFPNSMEKGPCSGDDG